MVTTRIQYYIAFGQAIFWDHDVMNYYLSKYISKIWALDECTTGHIFTIWHAVGLMIILEHDFKICNTIGVNIYIYEECTSTTTTMHFFNNQRIQLE